MSGVQKAPAKRAQAKAQRETGVTIVWDTYVAEAAKPPFVIELADGDSITIHEPLGQQMMDAQDVDPNDIEEQLATLCGDAGDRVLELVKVAPTSAVLSLMDDITKHFGLGSAGEGTASQS